MDGRLAGRVAIVTGTARGIGAAIARTFASEGAAVTGVDVLEAPGRDVADAVRAAGGVMSFARGDVADEDDVRRVVDGVLAEHGRVDVLVNNAAVQKEARLLDVTVEDFHRVVNVNLLGCLLLCRAVIPAMVERQAGAIVNLSSLNALVADPLLPVYGATKAGIIALTQNIAITYGPDGVRANAICPGDVDTEMNQAFFRAHPDPAGFRRRLEREYPLRRIADPEEIARVALFLASDDASFVSGSQVVVDGALMARIYEL
ncbi:MAG: glucose 1-dehydrogenase [Chloroflexi bacterium]|nr:glucose 1-dehydrogenase [Chloroflexota bacterium]